MAALVAPETIMRPKFQSLDVRPLLARGEDPCALVRERAAALPPGAGLAVTAPFLPSPLVEKLGSEGFRSRVERLGTGAWTVWFWREES
jgi:hypothetical protein